MKKINWKVRFNRENLTFVFRFIAALLIPALAYMGISVEEITSWDALGNVLLEFISNPFVIGLTIANALNIVPDPLVKGLGDSPQGLTYKKPKNNK